MRAAFQIIRSFCVNLGLYGMLASGAIAQGDGWMIEDFGGTSASHWEFISDQVMGGVSTGQVTFRQEDGRTVLHLQGSVSTANNGGFIQARLKLPTRLPKDARGLELKIKGNGQTYYIHARTGGTILPWNFCQAPFDAAPDWTTLRIPFQRFEAQGMLLRDRLAASAIKSLAVAAYGRDHIADISVADIGYY